MVCRACGLLVGGLCVLLPTAVRAQERSRCVILCAPTLKIEPTWTIEHLASPHRLDVNGQVERVSRESVFELVFALDVPTVLPRVGVTLEAIFQPLGSTTVHPFTGVPASALGRPGIRDNGIEIEAEGNFYVVEVEQTGGWISSHVDVVGQFSPAETPRAASVYTHKLDFEWDTAFHAFKGLPPGHWFRAVEFEVSLDYLATGLPNAGDRIGDEQYLDRASPWSLSLLVVVPVAPLVP